jgi:Tfp pilus assembly protein PilE
MPLSTFRRLLVSIARGAGLTLLELGALCAVLAVAAYFAVPAWHQHRISLRRVEARTELAALAQRLAGCHKTLGVYDDAACTITLPVTTATGAYRVEGELQREGWRLVARPLDEQQSDGCGALGLDDHGVQTASGTLPVAECWGPED